MFADSRVVVVIDAATRYVTGERESPRLSPIVLFRPGGVAADGTAAVELCGAPGDGWASGNFTGYFSPPPPLGPSFTGPNFTDPTTTPSAPVVEDAYPVIPPSIDCKAPTYSDSPACNGGGGTGGDDPNAPVVGPVNGTTVVGPVNGTMSMGRRLQFATAPTATPAATVQFAKRRRLQQLEFGHAAPETFSPNSFYTTDIGTVGPGRWYSPRHLLDSGPCVVKEWGLSERAIKFDRKPAA